MCAFSSVIWWLSVCVIFLQGGVGWDGPLQRLLLGLYYHYVLVYTEFFLNHSLLQCSRMRN